MFQTCLKMIVILTVLITGEFIPTQSIAQFTQPERIVHIPLIKSPANRDIQFEARLEDGSGSGEFPEAAYIYYRQYGQSAFKSIEMILDERQMTGIIPAIDVIVPGIEYYLEVSFPSGITIRYPVNAPHADKPFYISVTPVDAGTVYGDKVVNILSPNPGASIESDEVIIALTFQQQEKKLNLNELRLELNGVDLTKRAIISDEILTLVINHLRPGNHRVTLYQLKDKKKKRLVGWGFYVYAPGKEIRKKVLPIEGNLSVRYNREDISSKKREITTLDGRVSGNYKNLNLAGRLHLISLEKKNSQPQNRFLGLVNYKNLTIKLGDTQPRFSQFTMWGGRSRGVELNYGSSKFSIDLVLGSLLRPIEGTSKQDTSIVYEISNGDTTGIDTTINKVTDIPGTYNRMLLALRPGFTISKYGKLSFSFLKAKDKVSSINYGRNPKDNLVFGTDLELFFLNRRVQLTTETSFSMYNGDILYGPMSQAESVKGLIVINQHFEPLPADSAVFDENISTTELGIELLKELFASAMAHQTTLGINYYRNQVNISYKSIGRSFRSLGSPATQTDIKGFSISDRVRLFGNRIYLNLGYESYADNVNGRAETTEDRKSLSGGISIYTTPEYPNFSFNSRVYNRENDSEIDTVSLPDKSEFITGNPVDDKTLSFDFSADQNFKIWDFDHNAVASFNRSMSEDEYNSDASNDLTSYTLRLSSQRERKLETNLAYSKTSQNSLNKASKIDYHILSTRVRYLLSTRNALWLSGGINATRAEGGFNPELDDTLISPQYDYHLDFTRIEFSIGAEAEFTKQHNIGVSMYKVLHTDDGYNTQWDWKPKEKNKAGRWNSTTTLNYVKQDDFVTRLWYSYKF